MPTVARPKWPAAVSLLVHGPVTGTRQAARVLGVFPTCVYVGLGSHDAVLALLTRDALVQPIGLRLALGSEDVRWDVSPGDEVEVGEGRVELARADVVAARVQRPSRVVSRHHPHLRRVAPLSRGGVGTPGPLEWDGVGTVGPLEWAAGELAAAVLADAPTGALLSDLVGRGPGLTPSGDDAIAGVLLALRSAGALAAVQRLGAALVPHLHRTTSISAALLRAAAEGYAVPEVVALLEAPGVSLDEALLARVLAIGHSSGRDLVVGVTAARRAIAAHRTADDHLKEGALHG